MTARSRYPTGDSPHLAKIRDLAAAKVRGTRETLEHRIRICAQRRRMSVSEVATAWANGEVWCSTGKHWWRPRRPRSRHTGQCTPCKQALAAKSDPATRPGQTEENETRVV